MALKQTRAQLLSEATKVEREALLLSHQSLAGMKGREALERSRQIQRLYNRVAALRKKAQAR